MFSDLETMAKATLRIIGQRPCGTRKTLSILLEYYDRIQKHEYLRDDFKSARDLAHDYLEKSQITYQHWAASVPHGLVEFPPAPPLLPRMQVDPGILNQDRIVTASTPKRHSALLDLPGELRNQILALVLPEATTSDVRHTQQCRIVSTRAADQPPIARTCRQLRAEALSTHLHTNTFSFLLDSQSNLNRTNDWLAALGDTHVALLRHIVLLGFAVNNNLVKRDSSTMSREYALMPVRIGINLQTLRVKVFTKFGRRQNSQWKEEWNEVMQQFRKYTMGHRAGERELRELIAVFARACVDTEMQGHLKAEEASMFHYKQMRTEHAVF